MAQQSDKNPAQLYEDFLVPGIHARWIPMFLDYAKPQPGERALDVACGTGIVTRNLAPEVGDSGQVVGVDINPDMLAVARNIPAPKGAGIEWHQSEATALPSGPFDVVTCQQGLQFFPDPLLALQEMQRVLAPGGRVALSVFRGLSHHPVFEALLQAEARYLDQPVERVATPFMLGDADRLHQLLAEAGFQDIQVTPESHEVRFPSADTFVQLTLLAAAAFMPNVAEDSAAQQALIQAVEQEAGDAVRQYEGSDGLSFPMHAHMAVAVA
ncbi:class I SAM-dependent methyltransferase [Saccharospirillum salsuginis]|uniref:Ubiquinone/menaquinone biosynthesis methyltransferase n=1 Tax=Saccharospirillum salsuginis TaxID=418750 RepID=A0A918KBB6_9GAMM|nr:methyltransferase domain-containing protein [Saccharospirillum salsuginis]GGX57688.1 ubiquinone/menaquinone biosynthesis methyltransferase [Saccharospirillum salsuginis]